MVRLLMAAAMLSMCADGVSAQAVDWSRAGGDLFGRPMVAERGVDGAGQASGPVTLPPLNQPFMEAIAAAAERHGLDGKLLHALVVVESGYDPAVCSPAGACGLTQLMPGTASDLGVRDRFDPVSNLDGGADYLARQIIRFGDVRLALAAFNAGPGRVARLGRIPDIRETQAYVTTVLECYLALGAGRVIRTATQCGTSDARP